MHSGPTFPARHLEMTSSMRNAKYGDLPVFVAPSNQALGEAAAEQFAKAVAHHVADHGDVSVILATGNSQLSFIRAVVRRDEIDWSKVTVLHMDEYLGMSEEHPASFRRWMQENLLAHVTPKEFHGMRGDADSVQDEIERYSTLVRDLDPAICVMGIGENGHLAFNDPPADLETRELIQVVELDEECRQQQVGEGHFASVEDAPTKAISLTVHALLRPKTVLVLVPESRKADAVRRSLIGPITPGCPASVLQQAPHARLYLDEDSAA